jgi:hypothetical protein
LIELALREGCVVVHAQAAADVDVVHRQAEVAQFAVVADGFLETVLVVGQVGDLRAHVEVQQANALIQAGARKRSTTDSNCAADRPNLDFSPPVSAHLLDASDDRRTRRPTWGRPDAGRFDHQPHFGLFLDHDEHVVPELLAHQRQRMNSRSL